MAHAMDVSLPPNQEVAKALTHHWFMQNPLRTTWHCLWQLCSPSWPHSYATNTLTHHHHTTPTITTQVGSTNHPCSCQLPFSPFPDVGSKLCACLSDFTEATGYDLTTSEESLMDLELTPDIIPEVPVAHLYEVTGAVEDYICKFQAYCKVWNGRLDAKKGQLVEKRRHLNQAQASSLHPLMCVSSHTRTICFLPLSVLLISNLLWGLLYAHYFWLPQSL